MQQLLSTRSQQFASMSRWLYFFPHSYVLILKVRESLLKSLKISLKAIVKSILRCQKTINSLKNYFWEKQLCKEWFAHVIARYNNNTHLFSLLLVNKFESFLLYLTYKTQCKRFFVYCLQFWIRLGQCSNYVITVFFFKFKQSLKQH